MDGNPYSINRNPHRLNICPHIRDINPHNMNRNPNNNTLYLIFYFNLYQLVIYLHFFINDSYINISILFMLIIIFHHDDLENYYAGFCQYNSGFHSYYEGFCLYYEGFHPF